MGKLRDLLTNVQIDILQVNKNEMVITYGCFYSK